MRFSRPNMRSSIRSICCPCWWKPVATVVSSRESLSSTAMTSWLAIVTSSAPLLRIVSRRRTLDGAAVHGGPHFVDDLEVHHVTDDLDQQEVITLVKALGVNLAAGDVAAAQLAAAARDEIVHALLRLEALVKMLVAGEDRVDAVLHEQRLERLA